MVEYMLDRQIGSREHCDGHGHGTRRFRAIRSEGTIRTGSPAWAGPIPPAEPKTDGDQLAVFKWLAKVSKKIGGRPIVLNVAGPRESKEPGLAAAVEKYILQVISTDKESS